MEYLSIFVSILPISVVLLPYSDLMGVTIKFVSTRCLPSCPSKLLLESICSSCSVMKDCLRNNKEFEKYFREEEFETVHWPCDRCLEILKSIKLFWKIVIEKVLKINLPKTHEFRSVNTSIRNVAKEWRKEMVQDAIYVKSTTILYKENGLNKVNSSYVNDDDTSIDNYFRRNKLTETECGVRSVAIQNDSKLVRRKISKCTSAAVKTNDIGVDAYNVKINDGSQSTYKIDMEELQQQYNLQKYEVDRLKKENVALKIELQHVCPNCLKGSSLYDRNSLSTIDNTVIRPNFFENDSTEMLELGPAKDIDSEMIITLKNCKNETFRHVSMLQVLHKTNGRLFNLKESISCCKKETPMDILNTVHKTFGEIVSREIAIANCTKTSENRDVEIKASFRNIGVSKSAPSCTSSSNSMPSGSFESAKEQCDMSTWY